MTSPTQRSLAAARKLGWHADVVEKWIPQAKRRKDLFGVFDIIAFNAQGYVIGIQACAAASAAAREAKVREWPKLATWCLRNDAEVWAWGKQGPRGKRKVWRLRRVPVRAYNSGHDPLIPDTLAESLARADARIAAVFGVPYPERPAGPSRH